MPSLLYNMKPTDLISHGYRALQQELHGRPKGYGGKGDKWAPAVAGMIRDLGATSVLDYGCGQGSLVKSLKAMDLGFMRFAEYDPAVSGKAVPPDFADLVCCTDVLEHVEPDKLSTVIKHLDVLARKAIFVVVALRPSNKMMSDGRNAHLIQESEDWWSEHFTNLGLMCETGPKSPLKKTSREWVAIVRRP